MIHLISQPFLTECGKLITEVDCTTSIKSECTCDDCKVKIAPNRDKDILNKPQRGKN